MSPAMLRRLLWGLLAALLLCAAGGFGAGLSAPGARARGDGEAATANAATAPRDSTTALRLLGAGGHWGTYDAPETAAPAAPAAPPAPDLEGIARDYRLVGIERGAEGPVALLLPSAGAAEVIRDVFHRRPGSGDRQPRAALRAHPVLPGEDGTDRV